MHDCPEHPNVPPELYNLNDLLIGDLECAHCARSRARYHEGAIEYRGSKVLHLFHGHPCHLEELRESLRSTRMHYTTIDAPRGVKILEDIMDDSTNVLAMVFTLPISVRVTAVNLADIPRCVACVLFWVHLFETFDCVYFQRNCKVTDLERVNLLQEQVAATLLDPHNMRDLN